MFIIVIHLIILRVINQRINIVQYLVDKGCSIIVIAAIPIVAIETAIKQVTLNNSEGNTLVMATKGTIASEKFLDLEG